MWKKAMDYLGLGPDDAYDDYDVEPEPAPRARGRQADRDRDYRDRDYRDRDYRDRDARDRDPRDRDPRDREADYGRSSARYTEPEDASRQMQRPTFPQRDADVVVRRPAPAPDDSSVQPRPANAPRVQPVRQNGGPVAEPSSVRPRRFEQAQEVADHFKNGVPVIMNLEGCERDVARRLIDFASGICYALNGSMEKVGTGVYLLKPYGAAHDR